MVDNPDVDTLSRGARFGSVEELLADARSRLTRLTPEQAASAAREGARIVDIRPEW